MTPMPLDGFHLAALLGAAQGLLLAGVLTIQGRNRTGNRLLAVAMVARAVGCAFARGLFCSAWKESEMLNVKCFHCGKSFALDVDLAASWLEEHKEELGFSMRVISFDLQHVLI